MAQPPVPLTALARNLRETYAGCGRLVVGGFPWGSPAGLVFAAALALNAVNVVVLC